MLKNPQVLVDTMLLAQKTKEVETKCKFAIALNVMGLGFEAGGLINNVSVAFLGHMGIIVTVLIHITQSVLTANKRRILLEMILLLLFLLLNRYIYFFNL